MSFRLLSNNIPAMQTLRRLSGTTSELRRTFESLSSGLRINRASDDAAGLSIASKLRLDSRVYGQAVRNVNDALSMLNIAEGATDELASILVRMRELATQSANGIMS